MPMKKRVPALPVCMLFFLLAGCTDGMESSWEKDENAIRFSLPSLTRSINNLDDLKAAGEYAVWGHFIPEAGGQATLLFDKEPILYKEETDKWDYTTDERYWMPGNTYHFHALYPKDPASGTVSYSQTASGTLTINEFNASQPTDGTEMTDLLYASNTGIHVSTQADSPASVALSFRHLLARVKFLGYTSDRYLGADGKPDGSVRKLKIKSFEVTGIAATGQWNGSKWTTGEPTAIYKAAIGTDGILLGNEPTNMFGDEGALLLIPQSFTNLKVTITYEYTEGSLGTLTATSSLQGTWESGKSYSYRFSINSEIFFDTPQVDDWSEMPIHDNDLNIDVTQ